MNSVTQTQSHGLSERHKQYHKDGNHLVQDSNVNESILMNAYTDILSYATKRVKELNGIIDTAKRISIYELQQNIHKGGGGPPPNENNKNVFIKPDAPIIFAIFNNIRFPLLIAEDKIQGTNDIRHAKNLKKQATGNAIERYAKNMNAAKILCLGMRVFPYCVFASGCDFHHSETIQTRFIAGNMGRENHYMYIEPKQTQETYNAQFQKIIQDISIENTQCYGTPIQKGSIFIKAHKWNEMPHGSSRWTREEYTKISCKVIDLALESIDLSNIKKTD